MSRVRAFAAFWYDFVVGDDWRTAAGVAIGLAATAGLVHAGVNAWWLPPIAVVGLLGRSVRSEVRRSGARPSAAPAARRPRR